MAKCLHTRRDSRPVRPLGSWRYGTCRWRGRLDTCFSWGYCPTWRSFVHAATFQRISPSDANSTFKAIRETAIVNAEIDRLSNAINTGAIPQSRLIESQSELNRQATLIQSARQELLNLGLNPKQVAQVETGIFVSSIEVKAPPRRQPKELASTTRTASILTIKLSDVDYDVDAFYYEVQDLSVFTGCKQETPTMPPLPKSTSSSDAHGHAHTADGGHGGHGEGPHDGTVADWGGGKYHVEFTVDHSKQEGTVYILGSDERSPVPIEAESIEQSILSPIMQVSLKAAPQDGDKPGTASRFVVKHEKLGVVQEYAGTISGVIDGTPYSGDFKEEPQSDHKH